MKKIVISIPAYNEEESIASVIKEVQAVMDREKYEYAVHIVNDGSTDHTEEIAKKAGAKVFSNKRNRGLAETFKREMEEALKAKADIIVHTDADGQYPAEDIPLLISKIEEGYDLVLGSRFLGGKKHVSFLKNIGNKLFAIAFSRLCKRKITDTTTGFRAFTKEVAEEIEFSNTFTYTQEQIIRAHKLKFKIAEIPIMARKTRDSRLFNSVFEYAIKAWINIFRIYRDYDPIKFFGRIGLWFIGAGILIGIWLAYLVVTTGRVSHLPATILTGVLIIVGIQIIVFGFLADMNRQQ